MNPLAVCFDARMAHFSGIGTYIRGLLAAFQSTPKSGIELTLIVNPHDEDFTSWKNIPVSTSIYTLSEQMTVPNAFYRSSATLLHVPHYNLPIWLASRCIVTVHDLIHLKFPEYLPSRAAYVYAWTFFHRWVPQARIILTVSEHTKRDLVEMLHIPSEKIVVTSPGVPEGCRPFTSAEYQPFLDELGLKKGYFLYVGNLKEFKNVQGLLKAYQSLRQKHPEAPPMVFVGKNFIPGFDQELNNTSSVKWYSELKRSQILKIYAGARALIFPSFYEGFGLPPLEAMACGIPVICSNRASLPEVVGDAALQIDPLSLNELEAAIKRIWQESSLASELSQKGLKRAQHFTWQSTVEKTQNAYRMATA